MYYVISPVDIERLKFYHIPFIEGSSMRDLYGFYTTEEGKRFHSIEPMRIDGSSRTKKAVLNSIATDIAWIVL